MMTIFNLSESESESLEHPTSTEVLSSNDFELHRKKWGIIIETNQLRWILPNHLLFLSLLEFLSDE